MLGNNSLCFLLHLLRKDGIRHVEESFKLSQGNFQMGKILIYVSAPMNFLS